MKLRTFEEFSNFNLKERLSLLSDSLMEIVEKYPDPQFKISSPSVEINSIRDIYNVVKSAPSELVKWCKMIYSENQEKIDEISNEFKAGSINEEICILTLLSIGLLCYWVWTNWSMIQRKLGMGPRGGEGGYKKDWMGKFKDRHNVSNYASMSQEQLKKQADDALDKGDMKKVKEISKYLN